MIFGIKHFISAGKTGLLNCIFVERAHLDNALKHIRLFVRVGLMEHSFVAGTGCSRLACVNSRDDQNFIVNLFLHIRKAVNVVKNRIGSVSRARTDNKQKLVALAGKNLFDFLISCLFYFCSLGRKGILFFYLLRHGKFSFEFGVYHIIHSFLPH